MEFELLNSIASPEDLKRLNEKEKITLCSQIRSFLIEKVNKTGGHLASNLGVVELTVAIHSVFDSPRDHIIFDVGHQAYVHKLITGRRDAFEDLRCPGGLSGFTTRKEGAHDPFGAGHSSTAISAALGFAQADRLTGSDSYSVCIVGDGAFTGGMIHEALNNIDKDLKLVIVLNENRMSISQNKGAFAAYLARVRVSEGYMKWKRGTNSVLKKIPLIGKPIISLLSFIKNKIKKLVYSNNFFEELGLYYIGPVNGNDYKTIERALAEAKRLNKSVIIHTYTKKGKGYEPAEKSPHSFHSISISNSDKPAFHSIFAEELNLLAENDDKITAVTAAMGIGTGLSAFGEKFPERYFDVGIAEEHALTFSAGLCASGFKPYVAIYSTFLQRAYDNILHDVALQDLPVRMIIDRAGLAPSDGPTHHGIFDVAFLSHIPNVEIIAPVTYGSLRAAVRSTSDSKHPVAIRYPNLAENENIDRVFYSDGKYSEFGVRCDFSGSSPECVFVTYGSITDNVIKAKKLLSMQGIDTGIILVERLRPFGKTVDFISQYASCAKKILFVEEGIKNGGFSMITSDILREKYPSFVYKKMSISAIDDNFASPDTVTDLYDYLALSPEKIADAMKNM